MPSVSPPTAIGIDEWAWKKGQRYGTIIIDLDTGTPLDLLPDREATSIACWLQTHSIRFISRDHSTEMISGATQGTPAAQQIADRFHLLANLREAVEATLLRSLAPRLPLTTPGHRPCLTHT